MLPKTAPNRLPTPGNRDRTFRGVFAGVVPVTLLTIVSVSVAYVLLSLWYQGRIDQCQRGFDLLMYPGATLVTESERAIAPPFGEVLTHIELTTSDDANTVNEWYAQTWALEVRDRMQRDPENYVSPPRGWSVESTETGSAIQINMSCP